MLHGPRIRSDGQCELAPLFAPAFVPAFAPVLPLYLPLHLSPAKAKGLYISILIYFLITYFYLVTQEMYNSDIIIVIFTFNQTKTCVLKIFHLPKV